MNGGFMSITHGGKKAVSFNWGMTDGKKYIVIVNVKGRGFFYKIDEVSEVLISLKREFNSDWFPLANNVKTLGNDTEKPGLGYCLYHQDKNRKNRVSYAQGASYLGVVLDEVGIVEWNQVAGKGIQWRINADDDIKKSHIRSEIFELIKRKKKK